MILSHLWKFIFIKGRKVAGTSVEIALSTVCGPQDIITPVLPRDEIDRLNVGRSCQNYTESLADEGSYIDSLKRRWSEGNRKILLPTGRFYNHMALREVLERSDRNIADYRVFAVERSPYSKILSWANMEVAGDDYNYGRSAVMLGSREAIRAWLATAFRSDAVLKTRNIDLYLGLDGRVGVHLLRYAQLESEWTAYMNDLGVSPIPALPHAKQGLLADNLDPRDFFARCQLDQINEKYKDEFEIFGYEKL